MINIGQIIDYLSEHATDPVPKFIMQKEIYKVPIESQGYQNAYNQITQSKWYRELADEQWEDGSWGRFHSQDSKAANKQKFVTTEAALRRARELSLFKDDPIIARCINKMERYVREEETWTDRIEMHKDGGKSHLHSRPFITAANINLFDPENPVVKPRRDIFVNTLKISLSNGYFDEEAWLQENMNYRGPCLDGWNAYPLMILQSAECMSEEMQRQYLDYVWHRKDGIYYLANFPAAEKKGVEDKEFNTWLFLLEALSGFSLFSEFMHDDILPHLLNEINRIIRDDVILAPAGNVRYSESWRDKTNLKTDVILRIARIIVRC
jgi:hypothetical protein